VLNGDLYPQVVQSFEDNFNHLWDLGVDEALAAELLEQVLSGVGPVPLIFEPMAVTTHQIDVIKAAIREACPAVDEDPAFHAHPESHPVCHP
jgi:hypothetical protein